MNRYVCGVFTWQELSSTNKNLVPRLRHWEFCDEGCDEHERIYDKHRDTDDLTFSASLDLGDEASPKLVGFFGNIPESYCNDRFELSTQLDRARDKLLSAVIRKIITEEVTKESV